MPTIIAIDPGRAKCGVAVLEDDCSVLEQGIIPSALLVGVVSNMMDRYKPVAIIIGDGTGSAPAKTGIESIGADTPVVSVDESHTSELARARYLAETPPRGIWRFLPRFLRTPETPYDDFVAVILAERWLANNKTSV